MLTEYKAVSSQFSFARVHSYFVKWAKLSINKECWLGIGQQTMLYIYMYGSGHAFLLKIRLCQVLALQMKIKNSKIERKHYKNEKIMTKMTTTYKVVQSQFSIARVHSYFVKWAKLPINKECWLGICQQTMYIYIYIYMVMPSSQK